VEHYVGIDVSLELSSVCVVDGRGKVVKEAKVASEPGMRWYVSYPPAR
jgi:transposase